MYNYVSLYSKMALLKHGTGKCSQFQSPAQRCETSLADATVLFWFPQHSVSLSLIIFSSAMASNKLQEKSFIDIIRILFLVNELMMTAVITRPFQCRVLKSSRTKEKIKKFCTSTNFIGFMAKKSMITCCDRKSCRPIKKEKKIEIEEEKKRPSHGIMMMGEREKKKREEKKREQQKKQTAT